MPFVTRTCHPLGSDGKGEIEREDRSTQRERENETGRDKTELEVDQKYTIALDR